MRPGRRSSVGGSEPFFLFKRYFLSGDNNYSFTRFHQLGMIDVEVSDSKRPNDTSTKHCVCVKLSL